MKEREDSGSILPIIIAAVIIVGGAIFLFRWDAISNRFANAPDQPFEMTTIDLDAPIVTDGALSPDASALAFAAGTADNLDIFVRSTDVDAAIAIASTDAREQAPAWSPDGTQIAFVRESATGAEIAVVPFRGGDVRVLAALPGEIGELEWAERGIFASMRPSPTAPWSIVSIESTGTEIIPVTAPEELPGDRTFAASPDGTQIAVARETGQGADLWIIDLGTHEERRLTTDGAPIHGLAWGGDAITYSVGPEESAELWVISPGGVRSAAVRADAPALDPSISRDGSKLLYRTTSGWHLLK